MDDADITEKNREFVERANRYRSLKPIPEAEANGYCLFCDEPVEKERRWCNPQCRDDWQIENNQ